MINKLICWLFGHIIREKSYTGTYDTYNALTGAPDIGHYFNWKYWEFCPRCGKKLSKLK